MTCTCVLYYPLVFVHRRHRILILWTHLFSFQFISTFRKPKNELCVPVTIHYNHSPFYQNKSVTSNITCMYLYCLVRFVLVRLNIIFGRREEFHILYVFNVVIVIAFCSWIVIVTRCIFFDIISRYRFTIKPRVVWHVTCDFHSLYASRSLNGYDGDALFSHRFYSLLNFWKRWGDEQYFQLNWSWNSYGLCCCVRSYDFC